MHKLSILLLVLTSHLVLASTVSSIIIATVNGDPIYESDIVNDTNLQTREDKIKRAIQYRLVVQEAKKRGLERTPEIQFELNKLLYKKFIQNEQTAKKRQFSPSETELHSYYRKFPLIRIHHLMLNHRNETEKQVAHLALDQINKELKKGTSFEQLCTQFSHETSSLFGGDTDFRGPHNFPEELYSKIRALQKNAVSEPIEIGNTVHLFQWFDKKPFTTAPASYLQFLQSRLEQDRESALLSELVKELELKATIEPPSLSVKAK